MRLKLFLTLIITIIECQILAALNTLSPAYPSPKPSSALTPIIHRSPASCMDSLEFSSLSPDTIVPPPQPPEDPPAINVFDFRNLNQWLPAQINREESGTQVINKIADNGFQKFLASDQFKKSRLGTLNEKVKEQTKLELNLKDKNKIDHKIKAQLEPFQRGATLTYSGYIGVNVTFHDADKTQKLKLEETIFNKNLYYETTFTQYEYINQVGVSWAW